MEDREQELRLARTAIVVFGLISLFGDIIYEGARSSIPAFLKLLMAPAVIVGLAIGLGEFLGYALRLVSGYIADTTKSYWALTIIGYCLIISIPLLALANHWEIAVILIILERIGKAIRTPARDTLISVTTKAMGRGKAFGLHELFDQIGATVGPLIMTLTIYILGKRGVLEIDRFRMAFAILIIPYIILVLILMFGYGKMKRPVAKALEGVGREGGGRIPRTVYLYSLAVLLNTAGLFHIALILYLATGLLADIIWFVPILYMIAQGIDAVSAPLSGSAYDKYGIKFLTVPFILSILPTVFVTLLFVSISFISFGSLVFLLLSVISFGIVLGMQESIYRAAIADLTGISKRGLGYGLFNTAYGLGFLISGTVLGYMLDIALKKPSYMVYSVLYSTILQVVAVFMLFMSIRKKEEPTSEQ